MAAAPLQAPLIFYPAYCYKASPTYFTWVKLTARDIHRVLRSRQGYSDHINNTSTHSQTRLLFYLNHPIQFVQIVGVVVAYEDYYEHFWSFEVDDSSGEVIQVTCRKPAKDELKDGKKPQTEPDKDAAALEEGARAEIVKNIDVGTVVQVKGTISTFREMRQIRLERIAIVSTTTAEMRLVAARTKTLEDVLANPWVVSPNKQKRLLKEAQGELDVDKKKGAAHKLKMVKKEAREKRHADRIAKEYEAEERRRQEAAGEARDAGARLKG